MTWQLRPCWERLEAHFGDSKGRIFQSFQKHPDDFLVVVSRARFQSSPGNRFTDSVAASNTEQQAAIADFTDLPPACGKGGFDIKR